MSETIARHVVVVGKVQGVGFRYWTSATARDLGLAGWVRNRFDGTVEAVFRGSAAAIDEMVQACHRGPPEARVEAVRVRDARPDETGEGGFEQRETV